MTEFIAPLLALLTTVVGVIGMVLKKTLRAAERRSEVRDTHLSAVLEQGRITLDTLQESVQANTAMVAAFNEFEREEKDFHEVLKTGQMDQLRLQERQAVTLGRVVETQERVVESLNRQDAALHRILEKWEMQT